MRVTQKFSGTFLMEPGPVLRGELATDYSTDYSTGKPYGHHAVLSFGDHELARWDVTDRRAEWEPQSGDYWTTDECEAHEEAFVEKFIGEKLAAVFGGLEGVIKS